MDIKIEAQALNGSWVHYRSVSNNGYDIKQAMEEAVRQSSYSKARAVDKSGNVIDFLQG